MKRSTSPSVEKVMEAHDILGIPTDASEERVRAAYKALALKWHPDRHSASRRDEAAAKFVEINRANRTMLRNLRRAHRSANSCASSNASGSSPSSPESTSTSLPDSYTGSTAPSSCSSQQSQESSKASGRCSSHSATAKVYSPSPRDKPRGRSPNSSSPGSSATGDRMPDASTKSATTPKPNRSRLRKQSRSTSCRPDPITGDYTPKTLHRHKNPAVNFGPERIEETLRPVRPILRSAGADVPKQWVHVLNMTLEDLYNGKKLYFRVVRYRRSGRKSIVPLELYISPGTSAGTEIVVEGAGNERRDGTLQAIVFLVKEIKHDRFRRVGDDLLMEVRLPWVEKLNEEPGMVYFHSVDAKEYLFTMDYHKHQLLSGTAVIPGAGMPLSNGLGRGRVVIRWVISSSSSSSSSWDTIKKVLKFKASA